MTPYFERMTHSSPTRGEILYKSIYEKLLRNMSSLKHGKHSSELADSKVTNTVKRKQAIYFEWYWLNNNSRSERNPMMFFEKLLLAIFNVHLNPFIIQYNNRWIQEIQETLSGSGSICQEYIVVYHPPNSIDWINHRPMHGAVPHPEVKHHTRWSKSVGQNIFFLNIACYILYNWVD